MKINTWIYGITDKNIFACNESLIFYTIRVKFLFFIVNNG